MSGLSISTHSLCMAHHMTCQMVGYALQRRASADEKITLGARIVAESVRVANVRLTSSTDIGVSVPVN